MHINRDTAISGSGGLTVYDINRNRTGSLVAPFVVSSSTKPAFKSQQYQPLVQNHSGDFQWASAYVGGQPQESVTASTTDYGSLSLTLGENSESHIFSTYGYKSPITRELTNVTGGYQARFFHLFTVATSNTQVTFSDMNLTASALQNVARKYTPLSDHFIFRSSSIRSRDLVHDSNSINFIKIPSMYYGSKIKKGSVELDYYITGSKIASCADINQNGELIGTTGSTARQVVGLVMYDEGIIMLTSSTEFVGEELRYNGDSQPAVSGSWLYYGTTLNDGIDPAAGGLVSASYDLNFKGTNYVNTMTMFAHARKGHLNHSNNPTYRDLTFTRPSITGSGTTFSEGGSTIANIVSGSHLSASFEKTTYISKVHIYDEDGNLIAITSMAKPVRKTLNDEFTFKMKLDL
tara:strand:- start:1077 stop:2294 length:1218 start_codon:yes stop_codon:yes gene_type:complete